YASRRRHTRTKRDWSSDVCSSDLLLVVVAAAEEAHDLALPGVGGLPVPQLGFEIWGRGGDQGVDAFGQRAVGGFHPFDLGQKVRSEERRVGREGHTDVKKGVGRRG